MKDGFIKVAAATPKIKVADPAYNTEEILKIIDETEKNGASILVFSELTISGYTCGDLFLQQPLLTECKNQLLRIVKATENKSMLVVLDVHPFLICNKLRKILFVSTLFLNTHYILDYLDFSDFSILQPEIYKYPLFFASSINFG